MRGKLIYTEYSKLGDCKGALYPRLSSYVGKKIKAYTVKAVTDNRDKKGHRYVPALKRGEGKQWCACHDTYYSEYGKRKPYSTHSDCLIHQSLSVIPVMVNRVDVVILVELIEHFLHILDVFIRAQLNVG